MAQGKLKVKAKLPSNVKRKSNRRQLNNVRKAPKKAKVKTTGQKLQVEVEKAIRKGIEDEMRARASQDGKQIATSNDSKASSSKCKK